MPFSPGNMSGEMPMSEPAAPQGTLRLRAYGVGLGFSLLICALTPYNNVFKQASPMGGGYFPLAPFYLLFWLALATASATALAGKWLKSGPLLTGTELVFSWVLMVVVSGIAYTGFARTFFINLTAPYYFATIENRWQELLWPLLPEGLFPGGQEAIASLYNGIQGGADMGWMGVASSVPWQAWAGPLVSWGIFILICYFLMLCLISLIHRQATTNERMNFPLLTVPVMIRDALDQNRFFQFLGNRFLLSGLAIPVLLHGLNGLNFYFPWIPHINTLVLAGPYFPDQGLFAGFSKLKIYIYPAFIGFAFLASKQVSFSFWFFFIAGALMTGLLRMTGLGFPASELGITFGPTLSMPEETQMTGAFIVFFFFLLWLARFHFQGVVANALFQGNNREDAGTVVSDRLAFWGTIAGAAAALIWLRVYGVTMGEGLVLLGAFFMFILVATRVVCQGGVTYFTLTAAPLDAVNTLVGLNLFSGIGLVLAGVAQKVLFVDLRESVMPSLLHARKMTRRVHGQKRIVAMIFITMAVCLVVSAVAMLLLCYRYGIRELQLDWATRTTVSVYTNLAALVHEPLGQGRSIVWFTALGGGVMLVLVLCYHRFYWWPLHPIGYLMVYSSAMKILWVSFFVGWLCNAMCMRYGGVRLFRKMRYFFVGLIMGDFLMGGAWAFIGWFCESGYQVLPA